MARRTKAEAQATRESLLDAAEQLFQARGVSRTSRSSGPIAPATWPAQMVGREGFEPSTYGLKVRSSTAELTTR